jgi:ParB-like chromosome segregation protein Spo0J
MGKKKKELGRVEIIRKKLSELRPSKYNPRRISPEAAQGLESSLDKFGLVEPIVWNRRTRRVVGGHQRLKALRKGGAKWTDVVVVDLPEIEEKTLNLALNNRALEGEFTPAVEALLEEIRLASPKVVDELLLDEIEIPIDPPGDAGEKAKGPPTRWSVLIECADEKQQRELLARFEGEGLKARGMKG